MAALGTEPRHPAPARRARRGQDCSPRRWRSSWSRRSASARTSSGRSGADVRRLVAAGAVALLASVPAAAAAPAQTETTTVTTTERQIPFTQTPQAPATTPQQNQTEAKVVAAFLAVPKVKDWVGRYPKKSLVTQGTYDDQYVDWDVKVWSGPAGEIATGRVDDTTGVVTEAWTGPQVAWTHGARRAGRVRRQEDQQPRGLARVLRRLPDRAGRPAPAAQPPQPRPARAPVLLRLALVLQPRPDLHQRAARLPGSRLPARPHDLDRHPRPAAARLSPALAGVAARRRHRLHVRLQGRAERRATRT